MDKRRIDKEIEIKAPVARVWRALTDYREFGAWFRVKLGAPFALGQTARGNIAYPGYEHLVMEVQVTAMEPERYFAFTWHPFAIDPKVDYSQETPTLVEFRLEPSPAGTRLWVSESGFENIPAERRAEAFLRNGEGWAIQVRNISEYVAQNP
ncbi:MAG TPA: SRPBCC family protein [Terriglobales bacterium]|nr:SRPBCC family protein [Terriglobales bacterium]